MGVKSRILKEKYLKNFFKKKTFLPGRVHLKKNATFHIQESSTVEMRAQIVRIQTKRLLTKIDPRSTKVSSFTGRNISYLMENTVGLTGLGSTTKHLVEKW
jgi:hypothetical protein